MSNFYRRLAHYLANLDGLEDEDDGAPSVDAKVPAFVPDTTDIQHHPIRQQITLRTGNKMNGSMSSIHKTLRRQSTAAFAPGVASRNTKTHISQRFIPNWLRTANHYDARVFCSKFSSDGEVYMAAAQDSRMFFYRTADEKPRCFREISCRDISWAVLDVDYSPDNRFLVYSGWSPNAHIVNVYGEHELHDALKFRSRSQRFCLFAVRFSPDNRELIGGSNDACLHVYDIEKHEQTMRISAHSDDINTVAFADQSSNIFFSGSDDCLIKVWDRRLVSGKEATQAPVGVFSGHTQGITYLDSKMDGRYVASNSKDQTIKLWDTRRMTSSATIPPPDAKQRGRWDYRWDSQSALARVTNATKQADDTSIMTYRGHRVAETLIRCHFSPIESTGQKYIYSGSQDGSIYVYDVLTGNLVKKLTGQHGLIRDVSWHPYRPMILASSFDCSLGIWDYYDGDEGSRPSSSSQHGRRPRPPPVVAAAAASSSSHRSYSDDDDDDDDDEFDGDHGSPLPIE